MLQDFQLTNSHQLWRYVTAVVLCRPVYVSVNSVMCWLWRLDDVTTDCVTIWPCDEMTGSLWCRQRCPHWDVGGPHISRSEYETWVSLRKARSVRALWCLQRVIVCLCLWSLGRCVAELAFQWVLSVSVCVTSRGTQYMSPCVTSRGTQCMSVWRLGALSVCLRV